MAEWEMEFSGLTRMDTIDYGLDDFLEGNSVRYVIEAIDRLKSVFGENFEKLYELDEKYEGKGYFKNVKKGRCHCGSCDDIFEWWICLNR